jgi:NAD(P)-dependent dehydrogenase (short-subunit alcohol dehydrogenase family)
VISFDDKAILVAGGTKGIGLEAGLEFARRGAHCILTHKWGSADEDEIHRKFNAVGGKAPLILQADIREDEDTDALLDQIGQTHQGIYAFIAAAAFAQVTGDIDKYSKRAFLRSIEYTTWPFVEYTRKIKEKFHKYPRYIVGLSSSGPDEYYTNYDMVAGCKAALEAISRYLAHRLVDEQVNVNVVRARFVRTESLSSTLGADFIPVIDARNPEMFVPVEQVASAIFGICSGLMDAVNGQTIVIDGGTEFYDGISMMFAEGQKPG